VTAAGRSAGAGLLAILLTAGCGPSAPTPEDPGVRVVLITLDTLRMDSFAGLAKRPSLMPLTLERAKRGSVFANHYAVSSTTLPTHASMFTGQYPWEHGVTANGMLFPARHESVAERLAAEGFATAAVVASFPLHGAFGLEQGFGVYHNEFGEGEEVAGEIEVDRDGDLHSIADVINARADEVLDGMDARKQFLWFHYFDAHAPYGDTSRPASNYFPRVLVKRIKSNPEDAEKIMTDSRKYYDEDVEYLDRALQGLFDRLEAESDRWETHIVVASDHGEAFGEGGALGHGKRLVDVQIRVPLFILSPRVRPGLRSEPVGSVDIAPTLLSLAGVDATTPHGRDLTGALDADAAVLGMRRTFDEPYEEFRTNGTTQMLDERLFYVVDGGRMLVGNSGRVTRGDSARPLRNDGQAEKLRTLFAGFEGDLDQLVRETLDDPEAMEKLRKLGYTGH
jgi:arylsulfatase A-like enzyme